MGTMPVCNSYVQMRLRLEELYPEPTTFGDCDCTSYSYFFLSVVLFSFGSFVTVSSLNGGHGEEFIFSNMGHMWLIGPICISSGIMIAIKIILYLRRKSVIQMALRERALLSGYLEVFETHAERMGSTLAALTMPPAYDVLMSASRDPYEVMPPNYEEAMFLMADEKTRASSDVNSQQNNTEDNRSKETDNAEGGSCSKNTEVNSTVNAHCNETAQTSCSQDTG